MNKGKKKVRSCLRGPRTFKPYRKKLSPTHDPTSEPGTGISRRQGRRIRPKHFFCVRVVTLRDVGVIVATGMDDHRATVPVEELPESEAIGVELLFGPPISSLLGVPTHRGPGLSEQSICLAPRLPC